MPLYRDIVCSFTSPPSTKTDGSMRLSVYRNEFEVFSALSQATPLGEYDVRFPSDLMLIASPTETLRRPAPGGSPQEMMNKGQSLLRVLPESVTDRLFVPPNDQAMPRLKIISNDTRVNDLPWEWLRSPQTQTRPFAIVRAIPALTLTPPLSLAPPVKVLLVLTNSKEGRLLDSHRETQAIVGGLEASSVDHRIVEEPTLDSLRSRLC